MGVSKSIKIEPDNVRIKTEYPMKAKDIKPSSLSELVGPSNQIKSEFPKKSNDSQPPDLTSSQGKEQIKIKSQSRKNKTIPIKVEIPAKPFDKKPPDLGEPKVRVSSLFTGKTDVYKLVYS